MKELRNLTGFTNGQAEMREFLEKIKQDADKPESRLDSPKFLADKDEIKEQVQKLKRDLHGDTFSKSVDRFVEYDLSDLS